MFSDADKLASIMALGGQRVQTDAGHFFALYRNDFIEQGTDISIESVAPALECRSCDVSRVDLKKDSSLQVNAEPYRVKRFEPGEDGWMIVVLKR